MLRKDSSSPLRKDSETPGLPGRGGLWAKSQPRGGAPGTHSPTNPQGSGSVLCGEEGLVPVLSLNFPFPPPPSHPSCRGRGRGSQVEPSPKPTTARMADGAVGLRSLKFPPLSRFSLPDCKPGVQQMHPLARFHAAPRALLRAPWSCALGFHAGSAHPPPEPCAQLAPGPRRGR